MRTSSVVGAESQAAIFDGDMSYVTRRIGPVLGDYGWGVRYGVALLAVLGIAGARAALAPLLGTQAPLLPFVLGVFASAYLGGRGPAIFASLITPILATLWFASWPNGLQEFQWGAHVALFLAISLIASLLVHELQHAYRLHMQALVMAQAAARQANASVSKLRLIADAVPVLIGYVDGEYRYQFNNKAYDSWFGSSSQDAVGRHVRELVGEQAFALLKPRMDEALAGRSVSFESDIPYDIGVRHVTAHYVPDIDAQGAVRGFVALVEDVSDRKLAEHALQERERLLNLIYDNASDGLCLVAVESGGQFRVVSANAAFLRVGGLSREQVQDKRIEEVLPRTTQPAMRTQLLEAVRTREALIYKEIAELPTGRQFAEITLVPIADPDGPVTHILAALHDVTARQKAEEALRDANRRKDEFLAMLAHELRNPLAPIRNVAHILANEALDASAVRRSSELLQRQATQLARLVDDLLDVARITRGAIELRKEPIAIDRVIEMALESVQPLLDVKYQTVSLKRSPEPVFVNADVVRLCQILANLMTNAAKYSPEQSQIYLTVDCTQDAATVAVRDEGQGIDAQMLPHIFDLFLQGDRTLDRSQGGLGIGLTIVRHLVEMHGGRVEAYSPGLGEGSEFRVHLPRVHLSRPVLMVHGQDFRSHRDGRRVLVVEDNVDSAESLAMLLRMGHHEVVVTHDGATALTTLETFPADLILLDIGLPGMDGYIVAQSVRSLFPTRPIRIVAMTGYGREEDRRLAHEAGFDDHLTKPVDPEHLLRLITVLARTERAV